MTYNIMLGILNLSNENRGSKHGLPRYWSLNCKTHYCSNCCCIIISQSVCHYRSLLLQYNICGQGQSLPLWLSSIRNSTLVVGSNHACKYQSRVEVNGYGKHTGLLRHNNNYFRNKSYSTSIQINVHGFNISRRLKARVFK